MKIRDRLEFATKPEPLTFPPSTLVSEAVAKMAEMDYGSVVVVDEHRRVLGMVTERDILKRIVDRGRNPKETKLSEIMTQNPRVARADDNLLDWLAIMSNERFRRLPIVDEDGRVISIMTQGDFVSYTWPDLLQNAKRLTSATVSNNYQIMLVLGGVLVYSVALIVVLQAI
jgi:CBS domain-containing protein